MGSVHHITSLENLVAHDPISEDDSSVSFGEIHSYLVIEEQPDLMLNYLVAIH